MNDFNLQKTLQCHGTLFPASPYIHNIPTLNCSNYQSLMTTCDVVYSFNHWIPQVYIRPLKLLLMFLQATYGYM